MVALTSQHEPLGWTPGVRDPSSIERGRFVESHVDLVRYVALRIHPRLPASVELDDLIHDGVLGLLDACDRFDPAQGARFRTYAEARVRGAILDGLRKKDWRPRSVRRMRRSIDAAIATLAGRLGRTPTEEEIAEQLGLELPAYRALLADAATGPLLSLDELTGDGESDHLVSLTDPPDGPFERRERVALLAEAIAELPERERRILELYYVEGLTLKEIGAVLAVTESRICQIHSQATARLRVAVGARLRPAMASDGKRETR